MTPPPAAAAVSARVSERADALVTGDRRTLARTITLIESTRPDDREQALDLLGVLAATPAANHRSRAAMRIGITGTPGVGKSTFVEALGLHAIAAGHRVAVLSVDPSSLRSGGSILGDKTRMPALAVHADAFVRPSPSAGTLGGVARRTDEAIVVCEAAGFDVVIVETVGVGQSEVAVADCTDTFVLLVAPGGGDELQGVKRGIMELADVLVVNKADGALQALAEATLADYTNALRLQRPASTSWTPIACCASALTGRGVAEVWDVLMARATRLREGDGLAALRAAQRERAFERELHAQVLAGLRSDTSGRAELERLLAQVRAGTLAPARAAAVLLAGSLHAARP